MSNRYSGYCGDCRREVGAGHGELKKEGGKWIVRCGKTSPAPKTPPGCKPPAGPVFLDSPIINTPHVATLTDDRAAEILAALGSEFARPLPAAEPALSIGYRITVGDKEIEIGTCTRWVGIATDWGDHSLPHDQRPEPIEYVVSMIDGAILESAPWRKTHGLKYWTRMLGAPVAMEHPTKGGIEPGKVLSHNSLWWIVTRVDKPYYMSADDAEEMDLFERGGGWATPYQMREVTEPPAEREKRQAKAAAELAAANAIKQAREDFEAKFAECTAGLVRVHCDYELLTSDGRGPYVAEWREGDGYKQLKQTTSKITGQTAYVFPHGGYDDYRLDMFVDPQTSIAAYQAKRERSKQYEHPDTPATATAWLEKYRGCAGSEYYEWLAQQES